MNHEELFAELQRRITAALARDSGQNLAWAYQFVLQGKEGETIERYLLIQGGNASVATETHAAKALVTIKGTINQMIEVINAENALNALVTSRLTISGDWKPIIAFGQALQQP
jgi:hypothetical protein